MYTRVLYKEVEISQRHLCKETEEGQAQEDWRPRTSNWPLFDIMAFISDSVKHKKLV